MSETKKRLIYSTNFPQELQKIPIAKKGMSIEELRDICVSYMRLQLTFPWTPNKDWHYVIERGDVHVDIKEGRAYQGFPYVTKGSGNLYRVAEIYDEKEGVLDMDKAAPTPKIFGNACSGAASCAWARVIHSVSRFGYTRHMTKKSGYLPIPPCTYTFDGDEFVKPEIDKTWDESIKEYCPNDICLENGEETMYEAYAGVMPADGIVSKTHVRMISAPPVILRDKDGKIDGEKSYLTALDQVKSWKETKQKDGSPIFVQGGVDKNYSLKELYLDGYMPITFAEFLGEADPVDAKAEALGGKEGKFLPEACTVVSNVPISDLFYVLEDESGILAKHVIRNDDFIIKEMSTEDFPEEEFLAAAKGKKAKFTLSCQLYNGKKMTLIEKTI